jgi:hypothetical protein
MNVSIVTGRVNKLDEAGLRLSHMRVSRTGRTGLIVDF